jgi:hypothetical protein
MVTAASRNFAWLKVGPTSTPAGAVITGAQDDGCDCGFASYHAQSDLRAQYTHPT